MRKAQRPRTGESEAAAGDDALAPNSTPAAQPDPSPDIPIHDKLLWGWDDLERLTGLSRRLLQREVSARRMPRPDVKVCRRALWRPATITAWLDELAQGRGVRQ